MYSYRLCFHELVETMVRLVLFTLALVGAMPLTTASAQLEDVMRELFKPSIPRAVERGLADGGDLAVELAKASDVEVTTLTQAKAMVRAAKAMPLTSDRPAERKSKARLRTSALNALLDLFENVITGSAAHNYILAQGMPELYRIYDTTAGKADLIADSDILKLLRVLSLYCTEEGTTRVCDGFRRKLAADRYEWRAIFTVYDVDHPGYDQFRKCIEENFPSGELAITLIEWGNSKAISENNFRHPFRNKAGVAQLKKWLEAKGDDAFASVVAIPFVQVEYRQELFDLADKIDNKEVQLEAAWARAKAGDKAGIDRLARFCLDVHHSATAMRYLQELEAEDRVPDEAKEPKFQALATMSDWLSHPNELARTPDEMKIVDQRMLKWFDNDEPTLFTIIEYFAKSEDPLQDDDRGYGLVGSQTWSFFDDRLMQLAPEDVYAFHYTWEASQNELIEESENADDSRLKEFQKQWPDCKAEITGIDSIWTFKEEFAYPQSELAIARAELDDVAGFVVFDGTRSQWYPGNQFEPQVLASKIGRLHVGRVKLGFDLKVERHYVPVPEFEPANEVVLKQYRKWLDEIRSGSQERKLELLDTFSEVDRHLEKYIDAVVAVESKPKAAVVDELFDLFYSTVKSIPEDQRGDLYSAGTPLSNLFEDYAANHKEDREKIQKLIDDFDPHWQHNYGRWQLGKAAYQAGLLDQARKYFQAQIDNEAVNLYRGEQPLMIAELWQADGKTEEAKRMLIQAMRESIETVGELEGDTELIEESKQEFIKERDTYRKLFANTAEQDLKAAELDKEFEELIKGNNQ